MNAEHPVRGLLRLTLLCALATAATWAGCVEDEPSPEPTFVERQYPLSAYCTAVVDGIGEVPVETDYIPHVITCENGSADFQALKAQAVAARGYLYYKMKNYGHIADGTGDQVYSCSRQPGPEHYQAAAETAGEYLEYNNVVVAAFYVAGSVPSDRATCVAKAGDNDYSNTERFVTYNWNKSGGGLIQTTLGWVNAGNYANRGCKSQNGAHCLAEAGWDYRDILEFYYGMDIGIMQAVGACATPTGCTPTIDADEVIIDDADTCFARDCRLGSSWWEDASGYGGHLWYTYTWDEATDCSGTWTLDFDAGRAGDYEVAVHIQDIAPLSVQAPYTVRHSGTEETVVIAQEGSSGWVTLGTFAFAEGADQWVKLVDSTGETYTDTSGTRLVFDAVRVRKPVAQPDPGPADTSTPADTSAADTFAPDTAVPDTGSPSTDTWDAPLGDVPSAPHDTGSGSGGDASAAANNRFQSAGGCACAVRARGPSSANGGLILAVVGLVGLALSRRQHRGDLRWTRRRD